MKRFWGWILARYAAVVAWFATREPTFGVAYWPLFALVVVLYARLPTTNYIFDEQEALLANPYVNQVGFRYSEAIYRDFWGLPPNGSIGSYRPIPNYLWRGLVELGERAQTVVDALPPSLTQPVLRLGLAEGEAPPQLTDVARRSFFQHLYNLFFHAAVGATFVGIGWRVTRDRLTAWFAGLVFVTAAILTEAVCGAVGIADVLGGLGALLALAALGLRGHAMPFGVFLAVSFGLFSKESAIVCIPLVPVAALLTAPAIHPTRPARLARALLAGMACLAALVLYTELRKRWYPSPLPEDLMRPLPSGSSEVSHLVRDFMVWFHQAPLPRDPLNNPLVDAPPDLRFGGAMRVYARGLAQVLFPWSLSGDYSFPQEPVPERMMFGEAWVGWFATVGTLGAALGIWVVSLRREWLEPSEVPTAPRLGWRTWAVELGVMVGAACFAWITTRVGPHDMNAGLGDANPAYNVFVDARSLQDLMVLLGAGGAALGALVEALWRPRRAGYQAPHLAVAATGLVWLVVSYFPHSNVAVLLPTVRAERLWYFPVLGTTMVVALLLAGGYRWFLANGARWAAIGVPVVFLGFQASRAYWHATDYRDDLTFWKSTKDAVPNSAKAHLNYSVMEGARGRMDIRLLHSERARQLAPRWAMAHIYTGDTLCRTDRPADAWPHYATGFALGPNDKGLIALALQCLFDEGELDAHADELRQLSAENEGSWLAYLALDILANGKTQGGVARDHRPRSYNEGPKKEDAAADPNGSAADDAVVDVDDASASAGSAAAGSAEAGSATAGSATGSPASVTAGSATGSAGPHGE